MVEQFHRAQLRKAIAALDGIEQNADLDLIETRNIRSARMRATQVLESIEDNA